MTTKLTKKLRKDGQRSSSASVMSPSAGVAPEVGQSQIERQQRNRDGNDGIAEEDDAFECELVALFGVGSFRWGHFTERKQAYNASQHELQ